EGLDDGFDLLHRLILPERGPRPGVIPQYTRDPCRRSAGKAGDRAGLSELKNDASLDHHARLAVPIAAAAEGEPGGDTDRLHIRQLLAHEPNALLIGRGEGRRPGVTARAIEQVRRAAEEGTGGADVFPSPGDTDVIVDRVTRQDRAAIGR